MSTRVAALAGTLPASRTAPAAPADPPPADAGSRCWLALEFPALPVEAGGLSVDDGVPRAVSWHEGRRPRVLAVNEAARLAGVEPGTSVTAATAMCAALQVVRHDPQAESALLEGLACWASGYTSQVSLQPPRGLLLEIGASRRLFNGLGALLGRIRDDLVAMGHPFRQGVAPTPGAAWLFARSGLDTPGAAPQRLADAVSRVPLACLDTLPARALDDLQALGLRTLGDCMRLPRDGLGRRFGPELPAFLDRVLGRRADPRAFWSLPPRFERRIDLAVESADRGLLMAAAGRLLQELAGFLAARASGACALELELAHRGAPSTRLALELVSPCRDPRHLEALIGERLEHACIGHEVVYLGMRVQRLQVLEPEPGDLYGGAGDRALLAHARGETRQRAQLLVERLGARLGADAVCVLEGAADHRPERGSVETPWHLADRSDRVPPAALASGTPLWLLPQPLALDGGGHPPAHVDGPLQLERGPHRIESGWWDGDDVARDYYVARSSRGTRYWIFRECRQPARWFVHGIFA